MNKEPAEHKRDEMTFDRTYVFCPLSRGKCMEACECIVKPIVFNRSGAAIGVRKVGDPPAYQDSHAYEISDWACGNAMFSGERYEQNTNY